MSKTIEIHITQELVDEYNKYYLSQNKRRCKVAIDSPLCINFNKYNSMGNRIMQNEAKQKWADFIIWICNKQNISNLNIEQCEIQCHFVYSDKRKHDLDNQLATTLKFTQDALVKSKVIVEDTYQNLVKISSTASYRKGVKETIIKILY